ncbi:dTMP kinase [Caldimonas brevitalea]|uniref:Thymidylate kinase n=1 Tax=Caldimonas brevitalea TaxID=413882 RepID=A0A0G3BK15_9BURK|nr:dTMP kinase [Caldimonas brevitalea]AKJ29769.1 thymidylate kinase [Caldimonas brevitalea]
MTRNPLTPDALDPVFAPPHDLPGTLISIVGFDGSGKTTQITALAERFRAEGRTVVETRQPTDWYRNEAAVQHFHEEGGSRERARILALFAAADRHRHVQEVILPALRRGAVVICDRYVYATFGVFIHRGVDPAFLVTLNQGVPRPDFAFFLDLPTASLIERLRSRDGDKLKFEERSPERIEAIVSIYRGMAGQLIRVDGAQSREAVTAALWSHCHAQVTAG